jgi:RNA polymerase sigma factor for flagellar operon FliA
MKETRSGLSGGAQAPQAAAPTTAQLWETYGATHATEERNELLLRYIDLVRHVVSRLYVSTQYYHEYEDLLSCGVIGLMDAFERFDPGRGVKFETYAQVRIRGEIIDYMRRQDFAPTSLRLKIRTVERAIDSLSQTLGRSPADAELAQYLQMDLDTLEEILGQAHSLNLLHLDELLVQAQEDGPDFAQEGQPDTQFERQEVRRLLREELGRLPEKEQLVLALYYDEDLTLKEIGQVLTLSESRISQIHSSALLKLRTRLTRQLRAEPEPQPAMVRR